MNDKPAQAEIEQYPVYLDKDRNWHPRQIKAEEWQYDAFHFTSSKVFFLSDGRIGMEYGGRVVVRSIEHWMSEGRDSIC